METYLANECFKADLSEAYIFDGKMYSDMFSATIDEAFVSVHIKRRRVPGWSRDMPVDIMAKGPAFVMQPGRSMKELFEDLIQYCMANREQKSAFVMKWVLDANDIYIQMHRDHLTIIGRKHDHYGPAYKLGQLDLNTPMADIVAAVLASKLPVH